MTLVRFVSIDYRLLDFTGAFEQINILILYNIEMVTKYR